MKNMLLIVSSVAALASVPGAATEVAHTARLDRPGTSLEIVGGEVDLPSEGIWELAPEAHLGGARRVYLVPDQAVSEQFVGRRMATIRTNRLVRQGRYPVESLTWLALEYAREHGGKGPSSLTDLEPEIRSGLECTYDRSPWSGPEDEDAEGPFVFLLPGVDFVFAEGRELVAREDRAPLAIELRPYVDDGEHWVCFTDQSCERVAIDRALMAELGLAIRPMHSLSEVVPEAPPAELSYRLVGLLPADDRSVLELGLRNTLTEERRTVTWDLSTAAPGDETLTEALGRARALAWAPYYWQTSSSTVLQTWLSSIDHHSLSNANRPAGARTSVFGVMGGRPAVRETLQMQSIATGDDHARPTIDVSTIEGVQVASHPFGEMLQDPPPVGIRLASMAPPDRFFVYVARPSTIPAMLDSGAKFLSSVGGTMQSSSIAYELADRYLSRLGLSRQWLDLVLESGAIEQCALLSPDLFFIDGTDLTVVSVLGKPQAITALLELAGVAGLSEGLTVTVDLPDGRQVYWAMRDDLLLMSTSRAELSAALDLQAAGGVGSLGESAELRYMLGQLPVREQTRAYAYFSDPFIRRLVGPATKIGQLRRLRARADMERITAAALLARADGLEGHGSIQALIDNTYLAPRSLVEDYRLDGELRVHSSRYGTLADPATLADNPVDLVTEAEAKAYQDYVESYSRFWRQFFDPIAIRLDDADDGFLEATTFILPLIDSSIYNGARQILVSRESGPPMKAPTLSSDAVFQLDLNLREDAWVKITEGLATMVSRYTIISPAIVDDLGPGLHLAIHDSDPVIALGSGDIIGAFGGDITRLGRGGDMMFVPLALSLLTRPCTLAVQTRDPETTLRHLRQASSAAIGPRASRQREMSVDFYKVAGRDSWICSLDVLGMITLRYGIEVTGDCLLLRNIPWASTGRIAGSEPTELNGARVTIGPEACDLLLPSLHAAASEHEAVAALDGAALLYPLLESGYATIGEAAAAHMKLLGFQPVHPAGGTWTWDGRSVRSTTFGSVRRREQPPHRSGDSDFGLMREIEELSLGMQLEDDGLRTRARWKMR
jgi:hypothetical protein